MVFFFYQTKIKIKIKKKPVSYQKHFWQLSFDWCHSQSGFRSLSHEIQKKKKNNRNRNKNKNYFWTLLSVVWCAQIDISLFCIYIISRYNFNKCDIRCMLGNILYILVDFKTGNWNIYIKCSENWCKVFLLNIFYKNFDHLFTTTTFNELNVKIWIGS